MTNEILKSFGFTEIEIKKLGELSSEDAAEMVKTRRQIIEAEAQQPLKKQIDELKAEMKAISIRSGKESEEKISELRAENEAMKARHDRETAFNTVMSELDITEIPGRSVLDAILDRHYVVNADGTLTPNGINRIAELDIEFITGDLRALVKNFVRHTRTDVGDGSSFQYLQEKDRRTEALRKLRQFTRTRTPEEQAQLIQDAGLGVSASLASALQVKRPGQ